MLEMFPLSIKTKPFFLHISTIFSLTFVITAYWRLLLKAIPETERSITPKDLHLSTILTKLDTRSSVLLGDLLFSRSFTPACNIAHHKNLFLMLVQYNVNPYNYNQEKI